MKKKMPGVRKFEKIRCLESQLTDRLEQESVHFTIEETLKICTHAFVGYFKRKTEGSFVWISLL